MNIRLRSLFAILAFAACGNALILSRSEMTDIRKLYRDAVPRRLYDEDVGLSQINGKSFLVRLVLVVNCDSE
jgi:hypothetical protein